MEPCKRASCSPLPSYRSPATTEAEGASMARAAAISETVGASPGPPLWAVALLSAAALAYEILLMRLFSIIQWHHFAYMMISVAFLGADAAGAVGAPAAPWPV